MVGFEALQGYIPRFDEPNRDARQALAREGVNPDWALSNMPTDGPNYLELATKYVDLGAPIDRAVVSATDLLLDQITQLRRQEKHLPKHMMFSWERWWTEEKGNDLRDTRQQDIITAWMSDSILPGDITDDMNRVRPGSGTLWRDRFDNITRQMLYSYPRYLASDFLSQLFNGGSTYIGVGIGGIGDALAKPITQKLQSEGDRPFNEYWSQLRLLSAEFENAFLGTKTTVRSVQNVNELMWGFYEQFNYQLSELQQVTTVAGLSAGIGIALGLKYGPLVGVAATGGVIMTGSVVMRNINERVLKNVMSDAVDETSKLSRERNDLAERREAWQRVTSSVGVDAAIDELIARDRELDLRIRNYSSTASNFVRGLITISTGVLHQVSYAGAGMVVQQLWKSATSNTSREQTFRYRQGLREQAFEKIRAAFAEQRGARGLVENVSRITENRLGGKGLNIGIRQIGIPPFERNGSTVNAIRFEKGFRITAGGIVLIIGDNFSGKTSLLKTIGGVYAAEPTLTRMRINGIDFNELSREEKKHLFPFIGKDKASDIFDLKTIVAKILYEYKKNRIFPDIEDNRLKNWIEGGVDKEIDTAVLSYIQSQTNILGVNESWLTEKKHIPSGAEQAFLSTILYMAVDEPIVLLLDEAGGELTDKNFGVFLQYLRTADFGQKALMVVANVRKNDWLSLPGVTGVIKTNESIQGQRIVEESDTDDVIQEDRLKEIHMKIIDGLLLEPDEFSYYIRYEKSRGTDGFPISYPYFVDTARNWFRQLDRIKKDKFGRLTFANTMMQAFGLYSGRMPEDFIDNQDFLRECLKRFQRVRYDFAGYVRESVGRRVVPAEKLTYVAHAIAFSDVYNNLLHGLLESGTLTSIRIVDMFDYMEYTGHILKGRSRASFYQDPLVVEVLRGLSSENIMLHEARKLTIEYLRTLSLRKRRQHIRMLKGLKGNDWQGAVIRLWDCLHIREHIDIT